MKDLKKIIIIGTFYIAMPYFAFADFVITTGKSTNIHVSKNENQVVQTALAMFARDYKAVFATNIVAHKNYQIYAGTLNNDSSVERLFDQQAIEDLKTHPEAYLIEVKNDKLYILGSDKRGTAYGLLEISRRIGVSPWEWWADSPIKKRKSFTLKNGFKLLEYPSVKLRGIFINDEDFGLNPWSYRTHEPTAVKGQIGPKTHARIFELLLRLRANTFWPAMHEVSQAFYLTPGNRAIADQYGIIVGASHCEPMMRNANAEWKIEGKGEYDFVHNEQNVLDFWKKRVNELKTSDNLYTLGIRGVHDGKMQGANTLKEQFDALTDVIREQRKMIKENLNTDVEKVPQVFIPYKEVLEVYDMGLKVPEDVTLMWTDDNYGYIRHFPNEKERQRKGGNGIYYHISYWGRPHDYLWLATNHPSQIYTQMKTAYDHGAKDIWILNVGDIKPGEYLTELFLDMAWNINAISDDKKGLDQHLNQWLEREFGSKHAAALTTILNEYYRLAYIRKPEFMGNTRTEEKDPNYKTVADLPWSEKEIKKRISAYERISDQVISISKTIPTASQDAWFQLVEYPVRAAAEMNKKHLYAQLARHDLSDWSKSDVAFYTIGKLTDKYNTLANGKWKYIMNASPRNLPVFEKVKRAKADQKLIASPKTIALKNGDEYSSFNGAKPVAHGLGYERRAVSIFKGSQLNFEFENINQDSVIVEIALAPNHPVEGKLIRFELIIDDKPIKTIDYHTTDRNEEWKLNVLSNQSKRTIKLDSDQLGKDIKHIISIKALDEGVILDQIKLY